jgi:hypothetical protein
MVFSHAMGETFQQWLDTFAPRSEVEVCEPQKPAAVQVPNRIAQAVQSSRVNRCQLISAIRATGNGDYNTMYLDEEALKRGDSLFRQTRWTFRNYILARVLVERPDDGDIGFLTEKYGAPVERSGTEARWLMPDGTVIYAREHIESHSLLDPMRSGPMRLISVLFASKTIASEMGDERKRANPY